MRSSSPPVPVCPHCRTRLRFESELIPELISCPECLTSLVPDSSNELRIAHSPAPRPAWPKKRIARYIAVLLCLTLVIVLPQFFREHNAPLGVSKSAELPGQSDPSPNADLTPNSTLLPTNTIVIENDNAQPNLINPPVENASPAPDIPPRITTVLPVVENSVVAPRPPIPEAETKLPAPAPARPPIQEALRAKVASYKLTIPVARREVLREIGELSGLRIEIFTEKYSVELTTKIAFEVHEATIRELLAEALKTSHLRYVEREDVLIIEDIPTE